MLATNADAELADFVAQFRDDPYGWVNELNESSAMGEMAYFKACNHLPSSDGRIRADLSHNQRVERQILRWANEKSRG